MKNKKMPFLCCAFFVTALLLNSQDAQQKEIEKRHMTLLYGLESDIITLLDTLIKEKDTSFSKDIFLVFEKTRNSAVKEKIFTYYRILKDYSLKDYALQVLQDPYDEKKQLVSSIFSYVSELEIKEAAPYITTLLKNESEDYFDMALSAIGRVGGPDDAVFLAEYLKTGDLSIARKQSLMRSLGQLQAVETWDSLVEIVKDEDENTFVRMYAAEAIGNMKKDESVDILVDLFSQQDVNLKTYAVKGLSNYTDNKAVSVLLDAFKDNYYKVRLEAAYAAKKLLLTDAVPYLIYRSENDPETVVRYACYDALGSIKNEEAKDFLKKVLENTKINDTARARAGSVILENNITDLYSSFKVVVISTLKDDKLKNLRYALGKEISKYEIIEFNDLCEEYLNHKDVATKGIGLDIYMRNRYPSLVSIVREIASNEKEGSNQRKAKLALEKEGIID
jgi:HEAT repeat protein